MKFILLSGVLAFAVSPAVAAPLPLVTEWLDQGGHEVVVAYGITLATKMAELDRDKAVLIARANLAAYLKRSVISGSVVFKEWRHVGGHQNGGLEIIAVKWSEASAHSAAAIPR